MRAEQVQAVIKANVGWTEEDAEFLTETDDVSFAKIHDNAMKANELPKEEAVAAFLKAEKGDGATLIKYGATSIVFETEDGTKGTLKFAVGEDGKLSAPAEKNEEPEPKANTAAEFIARAPEGIREVLEQGLKVHNAQKEQLVTALKANARCKFTEAQLRAKGVDELKALSELAQVNVDFSLAAGGTTMKANEQDGEVPAMPAMKW